MEVNQKHILVPLPFLWIGFVSAISFMEAWLKFQAPGVTLEVGVSIGRLIFSALNKVEWVFALLIALGLLLTGRIEWKREVCYFILVFILVLQTFWLLPALSENIDILIKGEIPPPSNLHTYYILLEVQKVILLLVFGIGQLIPKNIQKS